MTWKHLIILAIASSGVVGCGDSGASSASTAKASTTKKTSKKTEVVESKKSKPKVIEAEKKSKPIDQEPQTSRPEPEATASVNISELFAPPKVIVPVVPKVPERKIEPKPATAEIKVEPPRDDAAPLPPLRLVGFIEIDGLQVILSVEDKLTVLSVGESIAGVQVVGLDPPFVKLKHRDQEFERDLNKEPWIARNEAVGNRTPDRKPSRNQPSAPSRGAPLPNLPTKPANPAPPRIPERVPERTVQLEIPNVGAPPQPPPAPMGKPSNLPAIPNKP